jgi:pimeloyl-ACP methyl ester carboxylesterase
VREGTVIAVRRDFRISSTANVSLQVYDLGGDGPPLLICHATGFCGRAYDPLAAALTSSFSVSTFDFRGHGDSDPSPDGDYSWDRMAEDVHAVAAALAPDGVAVLGHSMGAAAALIAETRRPGTLRSAYVFEPALLPDSNEAPDPGAFVERTRRRTAVFASRAAAGERLRLAPTFAGWSEASMQAFLEHGLRDNDDGTVSLRCAPETEAACYAAGAASVSTVAGVRVPVTVAVGLGPDLLGAAPSARALAAVLPDARLVEHAGMTHFGPFERPDEVATAALRALTD